jgi:hypothetical protein
MIALKGQNRPWTMLSWLFLIFRVHEWKTVSTNIVEVLAIVLVIARIVRVDASLAERERILEYSKRNYTWPLTSFWIQPKTDGWINTMLRRLQQIEYTISDQNQRYNAYLTTLSSAMIIPNYTQTGWGVTRIPNNLLQELQQSLQDGLPSDLSILPDEKDESASSRLALDGGQTKFISQPSLNRRILFSLRRQHERWSNIRLEPSLAYGLRLYTNQSRLAMHVDRLDTHVISSILHIGRSEDAQPWPIYIEDLQGQTQQLYLEVGDMLFYESSKCWHGRPQRLNGSWYTSLFLHYRIRKEDQDIANNSMLLEAHYAVPPHWHVTPSLLKSSDQNSNLEPLQVLGTALQEPNCPHGWCGTINANPWHGPAQDNVVFTRTNKFTNGTYELTKEKNKNEEL